ncbi:MAG TPA: hypothetical protein VIM55_02455 [Mucilaginibacter sp.]
MKNKFPLLLFAFILAYNTGHAQWYKEKFVIGTFADPRIFGVTRNADDAKDTLSYKLARGAYINLLTGPQFYNGAQDFSLMDKTLGLASAYGMHVMAIDSKLQVTTDKFSDNDAQNVLAHFKSLDPKRREALGGYSFGGEFPVTKAGQVKKWAGFYNNNDTDRPAYTYLLPCYGFKTRAEYEQYLDAYLSESNPAQKLKIVAYDYYPFLSPSLMASYFYNLGIIKEKAGDRPVWYFIASTTKRTLPDINDYNLRFMAYCPLAYGSKGALYYTYESLPEKMGMNYYEAIIGLSGQPTAKYAKVRTINYFITNFAGPIIMKNDCVGTYHVSNSPTNENIPDKYILQRNNRYVSSIGNPNILVGIFKSPNGGKYYLMLVNKSSNPVSNVAVAVPGSKTIQELPASENYHGAKNYTKLKTSGSGGKTNFVINNIGGGEMSIIEVD